MLTLPYGFFKGTSAVPFTNTYSCDFDGVSDYITMGNVLNFDSTDAFSISVWIKPDNVSGYKMFVAKLDTSPPYNGYGLFLKSDEIELYLVGTGWGQHIDIQITGVADNIVAGVWTHIVMTYDGSTNASGVTIYQNGAAVTPTVVTDTLSGSMANTVNFQISCRNGTVNPYAGNIDEGAIFNSELSSGDVTAIYNAGVPDSLSSFSPMGWWRLGDPGGAAEYPTITDIGSGGNNGTMTNMTSSDIVADVP